MGNNFYQMNNEILKLDPYKEKDFEKIQFNHYLCRKENLQRTKEELDRGLFKLSYTTMIADTGLKRWKVQELIKWFEDNKIIECIEKSDSKGKESIYAYTSVYYAEDELKKHTDFNTNNHTDNHTNLYSISKGLNGIHHTDNHTNNHTDFHTSKKEEEKEKGKNIYNSLHYESKDYVFSDMINAYTKNPYLIRVLEKYIDMRNELCKKDSKQLTERSFKIVLSDLSRYSKNDDDKLKRIYKTIENKSKSIINLYNDPFTKDEEIDFNKFIENMSDEIKNINARSRRKHTQVCDIG